MQDNLKEYIGQARDDFEAYPFNESQGWEELSKKISPIQKKKSPWKWAGIAASFLAIVCFAMFGYTAQSLANSEVVELEQFYTGEINQKITLIKNQVQDDHILENITEMDAAFAELKADLNDNVDNEEVIMAMMENYRLKLQVLEEILKELDREKREEVL